MNITISHNMRAYRFLIPVIIAGATDTLSFCLGTILILPLEPLVIIVRLQLLSQRNTAALGLINITVLNHPSLGPMWTYHTILVCCRWCPLSCRLSYRKSGKSNIIDSIFLWHKAVLAHRYFHIFPVWIRIPKVCIKNCFISFLLSIPNI